MQPPKFGRQLGWDPSNLLNDPNSKNLTNATLVRQAHVSSTFVLKPSADLLAGLSYSLFDEGQEFRVTNVEL
jgi:hypothetical protein